MNQCATALTEPKEQSHDCLALYDDQDRQLMQLASAAKMRGADRVAEIARFIAVAGMQKVGIAHCVAMNKEAAALEQRLQQMVEVIRVDCKVCRIPAAAWVEDDRGTSCNPVGQAVLLAEQHTELNIAMGLCLGHDLLFSKHSQAPVTTLAVKDRVHGHHPLKGLE